MDIMQLLRISAVLALIAGLDFIVYLVALKLNSYYRHKIPMSEILKMELEKGLEPINDRPDIVSPARPAAVSALGQHGRSRPQPVLNEAPKPESPVSFREFSRKLFEAPAPVNNPAPAKDGEDTRAAAAGKFKVDDRVELYGSKGAVSGKVISCNDRNSKTEFRYLVNWGKDGIWWVAEDQIEFAWSKGIEVSA